MNLGDYKAAISDLQQYMSLTGENDDLYNTIGIAYLNLKEYNSAIGSITKAISINPQNGNYYKNRGYCYLLNGNKTNAKNDAVRASNFGIQLPAELSALIND